VSVLPALSLEWNVFMSVHRRLFFLATGSLLLLPACSSGDTSDAAPVAGTRGGASEAAKAASEGPVAILSEAVNLQPQVLDVIQRLADSCVRAQGVTELPPRSKPVSVGLVSVQFSPTKETAAERGYGISFADPKEEPSEENNFEFSSEAAADRYSKARYGTAENTASDQPEPGTGGCLEKARVEVYGSYAGPKSPTTEITEAAQNAYAANADLKVKLKAWRTCLEKSGYPGLVDPEDALRYAQYFRYPTGARPGGVVPEGGPWPLATARKKEIAFAVADAGCADSTGLRTVQKQGWDRALNDAIQDRSAQLFAYRDAMNAALTRGQQHLKG
jgi:hypothetical protein